jgi:hypothetical protein
MASKQMPAAANKTSADNKPSPRAREIANKSFWRSPEVHAVFCDLKKIVGDERDVVFPQDYVKGKIERLNQVSPEVHGWKLVVN